MISEALCETEDFAITLINNIVKYHQCILNCKKKNISQYYCFYCIFDQINAAKVNIRLLLKTYFKLFNIIG